MTKNERRELDTARTLAANGYRDQAVRYLSIVHRSTRSRATQAATLELAVELGLADRLAIVNNCLAHVDDVLVPAVRS